MAGFVVSFAGLSRAQIAGAVRIALAQVADEVLTGVKGDDPVAKVQRTYLHFLKDAFPNLYGATMFRVRSATDADASPKPKKARNFKQQQVWLAFSHSGVILLSHNVAYSNYARSTPEPGTAKGPAKAQLLASTVFYNYTEVSRRPPPPPSHRLPIRATAHWHLPPPLSPPPSLYALIPRSVAPSTHLFIYRYILHESCSQFDSLPLTSLLSRRPLRRPLQITRWFVVGTERKFGFEVQYEDASAATGVSTLNHWFLFGNEVSDTETHNGATAAEALLRDYIRVHTVGLNERVWAVDTRPAEK